jgi:hypothetical protein
MMMRTVSILSSWVLLSATSGAGAGKTIDPGQYTIPGGQDVCLVDDGTWYGTTFNFGGRWIKEGRFKVLAELWGNYTVHDASGAHKANTTLTFLGGSVTPLKWHDWFDDESYGTFVSSQIDFVKAQCDPPFKGQNTHAATE